MLPNLGTKSVLMKYSSTDITQSHAPSLITEVFNVKLRHSEVLLFASQPDCIQNQTAVSDIQRLLSVF
jgi:hypothetical protein